MRCGFCATRAAATSCSSRPIARSEGCLLRRPSSGCALARSREEAKPGASHAIDESTAVPADLYAELLRAGDLARARGQHSFSRSRLGSQTLRLFDPQLPCGAASTSHATAASCAAERADAQVTLSSMLELAYLLWRLLSSQGAPDVEELSALSAPCLSGLGIGGPRGRTFC